MGLDPNNLTQNLRRLMSPADQARYAADPQIIVRANSSSYRAETKQQAAFAHWLVEQKLMPPAVWHNTSKRSTGTAGCPDFIVPVRGRIRFIEFKLEGNDLSPVQSVYKRRLEEQGHEYIIVSSASQALALIDAIL